MGYPQQLYFFPYAHPTSFPGSLGLPPYMPYNINLPQSAVARDTTAEKGLDLKIDTSNTTKLPPLPIPPSSPVETGNLSDYIHWHIQRDPSNGEQYLIALHILRSKYYDLQTIQEWKGSVNEAKWERLGIKPGIGILLPRDLISWAKERKKENTPNLHYIPLPPPAQMRLQRPPRISQVLEKLAQSL